MVRLVTPRSRTVWWLGSAVLLLLSWVFYQHSAEAATRRHKLTYQHLTRYYFVHIPPQKFFRYALVINLHGGGGQGRGQEEFSEMDKTADKYGFYVVYPNGSGRLHNRLLTWNAGGCCGYAQQHHIDDVGYIKKLLDTVIKEYPIDPSRIYVTGMSNGAMMAFYLAQEMPHRIAAIAPVAGGRLPDMGKHVSPMPIMYFHSFDDPRAVYHGGLGPPFPFTNERVLHPNIDAMLAGWARIDGCEVHRKLVAQHTVQKGQLRQVAREFVYKNCKSAPVVLWQLQGAGHVWPGGRQNYMQRVLGPSTKVINANEEMWHFFQRFRAHTN